MKAERLTPENIEKLAGIVNRDGISSRYTTCLSGIDGMRFSETMPSRLKATIEEDGLLIEDCDKAYFGDYIIKGPAGEIHSCTEVCFNKLYLPADMADNPELSVIRFAPDGGAPPERGPDEEF